MWQSIFNTTPDFFTRNPPDTLANILAAIFLVVCWCSSFLFIWGLVEFVKDDDRPFGVCGAPKQVHRFS